MPPVCTLDVPTLGVVIVLQPARNTASGCIMQPVHTNLGVIDDRILRDIEMATFDLDVPPTVERGREEGVLVFGFDPEIVEEKTINGLLHLVFEEYAKRVERHQQFQQSGPSIAVSSELKFHG